jgi:hypothetical protein
MVTKFEPFQMGVVRNRCMAFWFMDTLFFLLLAGLVSLACTFSLWVLSSWGIIVPDPLARLEGWICASR